MNGGYDERWTIRVLSGQDRSPAAFALRGILAAAEPLYAQLMSLRNWAYDRKLLKTHPLPRPTISVGNITTGGTGKTPLVRWLAEQLIARSLRPAILMRGYRKKQTGGSDEQSMLAGALGDAATVVANADRIVGAMTALSTLVPPDVFLLDDAFQHRRAARDLNIVLVDAREPLGFGHVLPRGLLREPPRGLARADAVIIMRSDLATPQQLQTTQAYLRRWIAPVSIYFARHTLGDLRSPSSKSTDQPEMSLENLAKQRFFAFAGIADPQSLRRQLETLGPNLAGFRAFADHHAYAADDIAALHNDAETSGAKILVTTEKDWVKIRAMNAITHGPPIWRLDVRVEFQERDGDRLLAKVMSCIERRRGEATTPATPGPWRA